MEQKPNYYVQMENGDEVDRCISQLFVVNAPKKGTDSHFSYRLFLVFVDNPHANRN
jgi:hypothetical protein